MYSLRDWVRYALAIAGREEGQDGMEYAIVAAIVIVAAGAALTAASPTIQKIISDALSAVSGQIP